jgi:hypothetical protein
MSDGPITRLSPAPSIKIARTESASKVNGKKRIIDVAQSGKIVVRKKDSGHHHHWKGYCIDYTIRNL